MASGVGNKATSPDAVLALKHVADAFASGLISVDGREVVYRLQAVQRADWTQADEWNRCATIASLTTVCGLLPARIRIDVRRPGSVPDVADIVVFDDDECTRPYLVIHTVPERVLASRP